MSHLDQTLQIATTMRTKDLPGRWMSRNLTGNPTASLTNLSSLTECNVCSEALSALLDIRDSRLLRVNLV
jgi:hypothetical protein